MSLWLDSSNNANKLRQSYVNGFLDISGGGIFMRNDNSMNFYDTTGSSTPGLSIKSDTMRIRDKDGLLVDISNSALLQLQDISQNIQISLTILESNTKFIASDISHTNLLVSAYLNQHDVHW